MKRTFQKPLRTVILGAFCGMMASGAATAATVDVFTETGMAMETEFGFRANTGTRGDDLAGAVVTATLGDGSVETRTWSVFTPFATGGVNGSDWSLFKNQLGFTSIDVLNGQVVTKLVIDASTSQASTPMTPVDPAVFQGASLFDISPADEGSPDSTTGSAFGSPFEFVNGFNFVPTGTVAVTYSGAVNLKGAPAVGDLFTTMTLDFTGLTGGGFSGSSVYTTDMDTLLVPNDLVAVEPSVIPLPAGLPLLLAGLSGLALIRRKRT